MTFMISQLLANCSNPVPDPILPPQTPFESFQVASNYKMTLVQYPLQSIMNGCSNCTKTYIRQDGTQLTLVMYGSTYIKYSSRGFKTGT